MKKLIVFILFCFAANLCFSQVSVDPTDEFYKYALSWESRGIVSEVPPMRPYPLANVKAILETVMENGSEKDKAIASEIYERVTKKPISFSLETTFQVKHEIEEKDNEDKTDKDTSSDTEKRVALYPAIKGDLGLKNDFVSFGYNFGLSISNAEDLDFMPQYSNSLHDSIFDASSVGSIDIFLDVNTAFSVGYKNLFFQGGIYRNGYSSYLNEGLAINDTSYHSGNLSFTYLNEKLSYTQSMSMIGATSTYDGDIDTLSPDKIMAFHSIGYEVFDFFKVSFYESAIYGDRTDLSYALPVPFMVAQGIGGASDNLAMGLLIDIKPAPGVLWETDIMADDFPMDDFLKLDFDSKYRLAVRSGLIYTPANSFLDRLNFNYTAILPYTYSHWQYSSSEGSDITSSTINYQNSTNAGVLIGSQYEPNSDAIKFSVDLRPISRLTISIDTTFIRHGNICETLDAEEAINYLCAEKGVYATDGSVYTHAVYASPNSSSGRHVDSAWEDMNWLNQDHIQYTFQTGLNFKYDLKTTKKGTKVSLNAGVNFEYIHNYGVSSEMFPGGNLVAITDENDTDEVIGFWYDGDDYLFSEAEGMEKAEEIAEKYKKDWIDQLTDKINIYFNFGVCIRF